MTLPVAEVVRELEQLEAQLEAQRYGTGDGEQARALRDGRRLEAVRAAISAVLSNGERAA